MLEDEIALMDDGTASAIPVVSVGVDPETASNGGTIANQAKLAGFDLSLPVEQTRWKTLFYADTTTGARHDELDLYTDTLGTETAVPTNIGAGYTFEVSGRVHGKPAEPANVGDSPQSANAWVPIRDRKGAPMYGDLGKVDAATATQASEVAAGDSENELTEGHDDYAGPFGGDNVPDNFTVELYNGSATARACTKVDGGEDGSGKTRRYLLDGDDPGTGNTGPAGEAGETTHNLRSLRIGGSLCDAEDVEIETTVTFTDSMGFGCSAERSFTLTCQWDASGGLTAHQAQTINLIDGIASVATATDGALNIGEANAEEFVSCEVEMN
jgi:hypothetical protein